MHKYDIPNKPEYCLYRIKTIIGKRFRLEKQIQIFVFRRKYMKEMFLKMGAFAGFCFNERQFKNLTFLNFASKSGIKIFGNAKYQPLK